MNTRILLCEDDPNLGSLLREYLVAKDYEVDLMPDGELGYQAFVENEYDLCIFDVMMPNKDGFTLASDIRKKDTKVPIIFLTVKALKQDILEGFKIGADDYITKPFSMEELLFRIEAIMRRVNMQKLQLGTTEYKFGRFMFDYQKQILTFDEEKHKLTTKEAEMLRALLQNANQILERNAALKAIWGEVTYFNARSMDVYITKLRKILQQDPDISIVNIHGKGYKLPSCCPRAPSSRPTRPWPRPSTRRRRRGPRTSARGPRCGTCSAASAASPWRWRAAGGASSASRSPRRPSRGRGGPPRSSPPRV